MNFSLQLRRVGMAWLLLSLLLLGACTPLAASVRQVDLELVNHIQNGLPEQDVFVTQTGLSDDVVFRITGDIAQDPAILPKMTYRAQEMIAHDPFGRGANPLGPFPKGTALGFTMGEWLKAYGHGVYTVQGDRAALVLQFENLVPNSIYTLWCSRVTLPPDVELVDKPCGAPDGAQNVFSADAEGRAAITLTLAALPASSPETMTAIAAVYHSEGQTQGAHPGDFGKNSHVQIFGIIPPPGDAAWRTIPNRELVLGSSPVLLSEFR